MTILEASNLSEYRKAGGSPDSIENHHIRSRLVEHEVVYCVSSLVHHFAQHPEAIKGSEYSQDDIYDLCERRHDHTERLEEIEDELDDLESEADDAEEAEEGEKVAELRKSIKALEAERDELQREQDEPDEACEHWIVSDFLAEKLKARGEAVGELFGLTIWGRTCTGQAIAMDCLIGDIAAEMGILVGQQYDWSK